MPAFAQALREPSDFLMLFILVLDEESDDAATAAVITATTSSEMPFCTFGADAEAEAVFLETTEGVAEFFSGSLIFSFLFLPPCVAF